MLDEEVSREGSRRARGPAPGGRSRSAGASAAAWRADFARYGGVGLQLAAAVGLFAYVGYLLDRWLSTLPLFLLVGVLLGFAGGLLALKARLAPARDSGGRGPTPPKQEP